MENLSSGILPKEVVSDIAERMQQIKEEIAVLEATEPPKDFTVEQIHSWLEALKAAPDDKAVRLLVSRVMSPTSYQTAPSRDIYFSVPNYNTIFALQMQALFSKKYNK